MTLLRRVGPQLLTLLAVLLLVTLAFPGFLHVGWSGERLVGSPVDVLKRGAPVALLAIGMTLVIATRGIDLSVGAVMAICGAVAASSIDRGWGLGAALPLALGAGLLCGVWNGFLVATLGIQPIVATLILMVAGRGIAQLVTEGQILTFSDEGLAWLGSGALLGLPVPAWAWVGAGVAAGLLVRRTALGLLIESVGINLRASRLVGVNGTVLLYAVYMASGLCAAVAGIVVTGDIRGADANNAGLFLELDAILAVALGGTSLLGGRFSILASLIGAMIIQSINTGILLAGFPSEFNLVIKAALVILILALQSPRLGSLATATAMASRRRRADEAAAAPASPADTRAPRPASPEPRP